MKRLTSRSTWWHIRPHKSPHAVNAAERRGQRPAGQAKNCWPAIPVAPMTATFMRVSFSIHGTKKARDRIVVTGLVGPGTSSELG